MYGVSKITSEQDVMLITFTDVNVHNNYPAKLLSAFAENNIIVDMISQTAPKASTISFSFTVADKFFETVLKTISELSRTVEFTPLISRGYVKINLFGEDMVTSCGVGARALTALANAGIEIVLITTSDLDISLLIREESEDDAIKALSKEFKL